MGVIEQVAQANYHDLVRRDALVMLSGDVGKVLDFGGGIGATGAALKAEGKASRVVLFDQVAAHALPTIDEAVSLDFEDTPDVERAVAKHGPFDTILALDVLEHLRDPWATVAALSSGLRPGGRLVVSVPNVASTVVLAPLLLHDELDYVDSGVLDRTHLRWFTRKSAIRLATSSGLRLEAVRHNPFALRHRLANTATLGLFKRFLARQWLMVVRKPVERGP